MITHLADRHVGVPSFNYKITPSNDAPVVLRSSGPKFCMVAKFYTIIDGIMLPMTVSVTVLPRTPQHPAQTLEVIYLCILRRGLAILQVLADRSDIRDVDHGAQT